MMQILILLFYFCTLKDLLIPSLQIVYKISFKDMDISNTVLIVAALEK